MSNTFIDDRQIVNRAALPMIGSGANATLDTIFPAVDSEVAKLFEDRNVTLTDGGVITFTGTAIQFTQPINLVINQNLVSGPTVTVSLGSSTQTLSTNGDMWYAIVNRTLGTATTAIVSAATGLPPAVAANQEIFLIAKRFDSGDGTQMVYFRNGMSLTSGQSARLGSAGNGGSGSGIGDDLDSLQYNASFTDNFTDSPASSLSSVDVTSGHTNATFQAGTISFFTISYDASKTLTGTGTSMHLSAAPSFTVATGDILVFGTQARKITALGSINTDGGSGTPFTIEAAFATNPSGSASNVSQAVYTKDINNFAAGGDAISSIYTDAISDVLVTYNDTASGTLYNFTDPALVAYTASADGSAYSAVSIRIADLSDETSFTGLPTSGTNLFLRFFSSATTGSGTVNLIGYKAFSHRVTSVESGGVLNQALCNTNSSGTPINCTNPTVVGGKTRLHLNFSYPVNVNSGTPNGAIQVFLDGKKIDRFINSTITPDASFTEIDANTIALDTDYSSFSFSLEVIQPIGVVDTSSQNTNNIIAIQNILRVPPSIQTFLSGSGTYNKNYTFLITPGNATIGDTYSNNSVTFTVYQTVVGSNQVVMSGSGAPSTFGTLTKVSGSGDPTLNFSQFLAPIWIEVEMVGGGSAGRNDASFTGGGGGGYILASVYGEANIAATYAYTVGAGGVGNGGGGSSTTFDTLVASAGSGITGGSFSGISSPWVGFGINGQDGGQGYSNANFNISGLGGGTAFGPGAAMKQGQPSSPPANTGGGGQGENGSTSPGAGGIIIVREYYH